MKVEIPISEEVKHHQHVIAGLNYWASVHNIKPRPDGQFTLEDFVLNLYETIHEQHKPRMR